MAPQQWFYRKGNARFGPVSGGDLKRLATEGKLEPEDLLRGVGMQEWVPASKVKGLTFRAAAMPPATPTAPPAAAPVPVLPPLDENPDPFAQFGLSSQPVPAASETESAFTAPAAIGASANLFDNLAAIGSQGTTIVREAPPDLEQIDPELAAKIRMKEAESAGGSEASSGAGRIGFLVVPFLFTSFLGFGLSAGFAATHLYVWGLMAVVFLIMFSFAVMSGFSKMVGLFAGNMMLKAGIKAETIALGYGGLLGLFTLYFCLAGYIWGTLQFNPYQGVFNKEPIIELTEEEEEGKIELDLFNPEKGDAIDAMDEFRAKMKEKEKREYQKDAGFLGVFTEPISVTQSLLPYWVFQGFYIRWWFWLVNAGILIPITAHSTWMANLGADPTRGGL